MVLLFARRVALRNAFFAWNRLRMALNVTQQQQTTKRAIVPLLTVEVKENIRPDVNALNTNNTLKELDIHICIKSSVASQYWQILLYFISQKSGITIVEVII